MSRSALVQMLPAEKRAVSVIALASMFRMFGLFALLPVLALHAAGLDGATPVLIGLAVGAYGLTQAALQIPLGALSDRIGRLPVIIGGLAVFAIGCLVAAASDTVTGVIVGRLLQGAGAISATLSALLADLTRAEVRTRSMAFFGIGIGGAFLLAMILGPVIAAAYGVGSLFLVGAALAGFAALLMTLLPPRPRRTSAAQPMNLRAAFKPTLIRLDLYVFLLHALITASFVSLPFVLSQRLMLPLTDHWKIYVAALGISLLGTVPLVIFDDRNGKAVTVRLSVMMMLTGFLLLAFAPTTVAIVIAALAVFFAGFNFLEAGLPARLSLLADGDSRGASLGVFASAQVLGVFFGGMAGGLLLSTGRPADVFVVATLLAAAWLLFDGLVERREIAASGE